MNLILADAIHLGGGGGGDIIHSMLVVLIVAICLVIVWWLGNWAFSKLGVPAIVLTVWMGVFLFIGAIFLINLLLSLVGHGFIAW